VTIIAPYRHRYIDIIINRMISNDHINIVHKYRYFYIILVHPIGSKAHRPSSMRVYQLRNILKQLILSYHYVNYRPKNIRGPHPYIIEYIYYLFMIRPYHYFIIQSIYYQLPSGITYSFSLV